VIHDGHTSEKAHRHLGEIENHLYRFCGKKAKAITPEDHAKLEDMAIDNPEGNRLSNRR
jgi:hypothetical protein